MTSNWPILSALIWLPIFGAVLILAAGQHRAGLAKVLALAVSGLTFVLSITLFTGFDTSTAAMQFTELKPWIETFNINYSLGVDGFSVPLILLTTFFGVLVVIAGWESITDKVHQYMACFLVMEGLMVGVFSALDALLFYAFFEAMLIPMFLVIGMWGGPNKSLRIDQVLPVHLPRLGVHADRPDLPVHPVRYLVDSRMAPVPAGPRRPEVAVPRFPRRILGEDSDVAGAHMVAGRAR